ncbi:MAG: Rrf2 family transcriptional regulator [Mucilaginibacter polytrichastri]|nr:Rrf2 family transcriptional regulator [Mucilaginibacter polytrichastri]
MSNTRFSLSIHILTLLASAKPGEWLSSDFIAGSANTNPALIRKELISLRKMGLVESKEGKNGGSRLAKSGDKISIADVYKSVNRENIIGKISTPNPDCPVGRQINKHLTDLFADVEQHMLSRLGSTTLQQFCDRFK